jgi:magnesium-transporting ATPase (P-type)
MGGSSERGPDGYLAGSGPAAQPTRWPRGLLDQFTRPPTILLAGAAVLAWGTGTSAVSVAVIAVAVINATVRVVQERQGERAVDPSTAFPLPSAPGLPGDVAVITRRDRYYTLLLRAWTLLGSVCAVLVMGGHLDTMWRAGWTPGDPTGVGTPSHHAYVQATTLIFAGIVACQLGAAVAARTDHRSWMATGPRATLPRLGATISAVLLISAAIHRSAPHYLSDIFDAEALRPAGLPILTPFLLIVWGADESVRLVDRRQRRHAMPIALTPP